MSVKLKLFLCLLAWMSVLHPGQAQTLPLVVDFELTNGGFTTTSLNSWKWGVPASVQGPASAHSGTQVWGTNLSGSYASNLDAALVSPNYDLSSAAGKHVVLHWWQYLVTEEGFDYAEVQVSKNGGGSWQTVFGPADGVVNDSWAQHTVLLDPSYATAQFKVRFRFVSDSMNAEGGFYVDDVRISAAGFTEAVARQDFEADDGGYVEDGTNSSWAYGIPVTAPGVAASGQSAWATNLNGFYNANEDSTLTSPSLDLSPSAGKLLAVTWQQYFETEAGYDLVDFEVSADDGASWTQISTQSGAVSTAGWTSQQAFIPAQFATSTFKLRFRLQSDEAFQYNGVALDDIAILSTEELFPTVGSFSKSAPENISITFSSAEFKAAYTDPDGGDLTGIVIHQLPASGTLNLGGTPVSVNDFIPTSALHSLVYVPAASTTGVWSFQYQADNVFTRSEPATVTLNILAATQQVTITSDPQSVTVNPGESVSFEVVATSALTLSYQWRKDGEDIQGANAATYTINAVSEGDENDYDVVVSNAEDSATSSSASLNVNDPVVILSQPSNTSINEETDVTFNVSASGTGRLDYQWYLDDEPLLNETFPALTIEDAEEADQGVYHCVVSNVVGPQSTEPFTLTVLLKPRIAVHPKSIGIQKFLPASFEVEVEGAGPFTYQWLKDGIEIPGATSQVLSIQDLRSENMGGYSVRVSNGWASVESEPADLQVLLWQDVRGTYQDVLERDEVAEGESPYSGRLTVTLNGLGTASGALTYEGSTHRFSGRLDSQLALERLIRRGKRSSLKVRIQLDSRTSTISASIAPDESGAIVTSTANLPKHLYDKSKNAAPQQGRYTVLLDPESGVLGASQAPSFLTLVVAANGRASVTGKTASGASITDSAYLHDTGRLPFHRIFGKSGDLCGRLVFDLDADRPLVGGDLVWSHLPKATAVFLPTPFVVSLEASGSLYVAPTRQETVVTLPQNAEQLELSIEGPITDGSLARWLRLEPVHQFLVDPDTAANIKFKLTPSTGRIRGSFVDAVTKKKYVLEGVALQAQQRLGGFFLAVTEPGSFNASPLLE